MVARQNVPKCTASRRRARKFTFSSFLTFHTNSQWFFNDFSKISSLRKIHLEKSHFFLSHVCSVFRVHLKTCRTSAVILTFVFGPNICVHVYTWLFARNLGVSLILRPPNKTYCNTPVPLTICSKPTVKPQCRCWCDFCPTSPAPLLEIS